MNNLQAVIFDMNGTVLADEGLYTKSFKSVLSSLGVNEEFALTKGISLYKNWQNLTIIFNIDNQKIEDLVALTQEEYKKRFDKIKLRRGFFGLNRELKDNKIWQALATSNEREITDFVLEKLSLKNCFDVVVTADQVNEVKPNPEIFLLTANLLGVEPKNAIVIEDAQAGIDAALAGGFKVIGITSDTELKNTDLNISDFTDLSLESLENMLN